MNFFRQVSLGITSYSDAHRLIVKHKLWGYIIAPGLINIFIFIISTILIINVSDTIVEIILNYISSTLGIARFLAANKTWLSFFISLIIKVLFFFTYISIYKYIILLLMSPLLALLSERVEKIISGKNYSFHFMHFMNDVLRGMLLALRNLIIEICLLFLICILSFIPIVNLICPFLSFYISSYYYGFSMLDYSNERKKFTLKKSIHFISMQRGVAFGNGAIFYFLLLIPFAGWLIAPAYSVTAAAIAREQLKDY